jgi:hypothetical protein
MPVRTRTDMHIGLDIALDVLNASPTNRLDPAIKDYFLNRTINEYVKGVIAKANTSDETKRIPIRALTHGDILSKYNDIYTLIKIDESILPSTSIDNNFYQYILPTDLLRFESSYSFVRPVDCITYPATTPPTLTNSSGAGTVDAGIHKYAITFVYPTVETDIIASSITSITVGASKNVELTNILPGLTGCTARKIYRTKLLGNWYVMYLVTTIANNTATIYTDSATDASLTTLYTGNTHDTQLTNLLLSTYDIVSFNDNPYGGKKKYIGSILESNSTLLSGNLRIFHNQRYAISRVGIIYVKKPAILISGTDCDLPVSVHDTIVDETAKFIAASSMSGNYQQLLMEAKNKPQ